MRRWMVALFLVVMTGAAHAQQPPPETDLPGQMDFRLAVNSVAINLQQLSRAYETFATACIQLQRSTDKVMAASRYWQDACQSTPGCGAPTLSSPTDPQKP